MSSLDLAIALASKAHFGQVDKSGRPYILHPLRLMYKFTNECEQIVGVLHDVVEDGNVTLDDLTSYGFSTSIVQAIDCLTKRCAESYNDFVIRLSSNALARKVKIEDIKDNLDVTRLSDVSDRDLFRIAKYHKALQFLIGVTAN